MIRRETTLRAVVYLLLWLPPVIYTAKSSNACRRIDAAFSLPENSRTFFISGGEYIEYNSRLESEANVGRTRKLGLAPGLKDIDAAFSSNGSIYLLQDCNFFRYKIATRRRKILKFREQGLLSEFGLPCHVDAALNWAEDIFVFAGCQIWKWNADRLHFYPGGNLTDRGLPCDLDAAVVWGKKGEIFVKGAQFWRFDGSMRGPFHTDDLHLCSWYLCGEADWMQEKRSSEKCNGDSRFCRLRLDQVTMAGLHNAGSGFAGSLGFDCILRNHAESITRQLEFGIRHLDIDPCYDPCGLLGTCHSVVCGGSICAIIKQLRTFLRDNRDEVVTVNFNHEIKQPEKVFPSLNRQLQTQLGPMLNSRFREAGEKKWPTLRYSVRTNQRVFIFYAPIITDPPYKQYLDRFKWIHDENLYGSTWRPFSVVSGCQNVVNITSHMCEARQWKQLTEVSIVPESALFQSCIPSTAAKCKPYLHEALEACEGYRFQRQKSPNVLLVDYPEVGRDEVPSVFNAVYHQNLRNVIAHLSRKCQVKVDAAVKVPGSDFSLFFVGDKILVYSDSKKSQINSRPLAGVLTNHIDAAYILPGTNTLRIIEGCEMWDVEADSINRVVTPRSRMSPCVKPDAAVVWKSRLHIFKDCHVTPNDMAPIALALWGLPCNIDAALDNGDHLTVFKGNHYWKYTGQGNATLEGKTLDWRVDAVRCCGGKSSEEKCKNRRKFPSPRE
ncbi:hypothetical protein BsWGS_23247 [Bradybaena similaris]